MYCTLFWVKFQWVETHFWRDFWQNFIFWCYVEKQKYAVDTQNTKRVRGPDVQRRVKFEMATLVGIFGHNWIGEKLFVPSSPNRLAIGSQTLDFGFEFPDRRTKAIIHSNRTVRSCRPKNEPFSFLRLRSHNSRITSIDRTSVQIFISPFDEWRFAGATFIRNVYTPGLPRRPDAVRFSSTTTGSSVRGPLYPYTHSRR